MGSGRAKRFAAVAVAALLLAVVSVALVATAASNPRPLTYACASNLYNAKKVLHYVARPSECRGAGKTLVRFASDFPVYTCRKEHGGFAARQRKFQFPSGIRGHGPAGLMRLVDDLKKCAPATQPNETPITLPQLRSRLFCAATQGRELRWATKVSDCDRKEFPVRLAPRSASADGNPVARADSASTDEDHPVNIAVLANDRNTSSSNSNAGLHVDSVDTTGTTGLVTVNPDDTIKYDPNGKFESLKVGQTATDTFKYRAKKGSHTSSLATVTVTITGVNDAPVAADDAATTDKDHSKQIAVLSNDTDPDGDSLSVSVDTTGTQGTVTVNGDGTVTYNPNHAFDGLTPHQSAHDTFKYKANDGHTDSNTATVDVTVTGVNRAPVLGGTESTALAYTSGAPATAITSTITASDVDSANLTSAKVSVSSGFVSAQDTLSFANTAAITGSYDSSTGVLTLTGSASVSDYQAALRSVKYQATPPTPSGSRTVSFQVDDGEANNHASNTVTRDIAITNDDHAPTDLALSASSIPENQPAGTTVGTFSTTDADAGDSHTYALVSGTGSADNGSFTISGNTLKSAASFDFETKSSYAIRVQTDDGRGGTFQKQLTVTVTNVNDAPTDLALSASSVPENQPTGTAVGTFSTTDQDAGDTHSYTLVSGTGSTDNGSFTISGNTLNTNASFDFETKSSYAIRVQTDDGNGGTFQKQFTISVTNVNETPTDIALSPSNIDENQPANTTVGNFSTTDPDTGDTFTYTLVSGTGSTDNGSFTITGNALKASASFDFETKNSYSIRVRSTDAGALFTEKQFTITINNVNEPPVPTADSYNGIGNTALYVGTTRAAGDAGKVLTGSVRANDTDPETPTNSLTIEATTDQATTQSGKVTMNADGTFTYQPPAGVTGLSDTFSYRVCDTTPCNNSTPASDQATGSVTVPLSGQVWYVKNNAATGPGNNDGTSDGPFTALASADSASGTGDTTFVFKGDGSQSGYGAGYTMAQNERLLGEVNGLTLGADTLYSPVATAYPNITNLNADVVTLASGAELRGFNIDPQGTGGGIFGTGLGASTVTIDNNKVVDSTSLPQLAGTQPGLEILTSPGTTTNVSNLTVNNKATGVSLNNAATVNFVSAGTISLTSDGGPGLVAANGAGSTSLGSGSVFDDITVTNSGTGGVGLSGTTGTTTFGNLNLTTTAGATAGFQLASAGTVNVPSGGTADVHATGGPAIDIAGTTTGTGGYNFGDVDSTSSSGDGIHLAGLGSGAFSANNNSTISGQSGVGFDLNGGSGAITFPGTFADSNGAASLTARVQNRTAGAVTFGGPINYTSSGGGGIVVSNNTGGTTDFTNGTKTLNTADHDAVSMTSDTGHTLTLSGGGLDIDTTTGKGIDASGGGTLNVSGSTNSITSVSGQALGISSTTIGSGGVTLQSISAGNNGAPADPTNGIVLNNTGSTAGLTVQGGGSVVQGGNNTGGTIQHTTGDAIRLTATKSPSFNNMFLDTSGHSGIEGFDSGANDGVHGFSFTNGKIASAGQGAANDVKDGAIAFNQITAGPADDNNVDGAVTIDNNIVTSPYGRGYDIQQNNGTISNLSIQDNALTSDNSAATSSSHGIQVSVNGADSGGGVANVTKATIDNNNVTGFPNGHGIAVVGGNTAASAATGTGNTFGTPDGNPNNGVDTNSVQVTNNLVHGYAGATRMTGNAIQVDVEGRGQANLYVANNGSAANPITNSKLQPIGIGIGGAVTVDGNFTNNYVTSTTDDNGAAGIGVTTGNRIVTGPTDLDGAVARLVFASNIVTASSGPGLNVVMLSRDATEKARITNNNLANPLQPATAGMRVQVGSNTSNAAEIPSMCAEIDSNTVGTGPVGGGGFQVPGINLYAFQPSADFKLNAWPGPFNNAGAESFVAGKNPGSAQGGGSAFVGQKVAVRTGNLTASCAIGY